MSRMPGTGDPTHASGAPRLALAALALAAGTVLAVAESVQNVVAAGAAQHDRFGWMLAHMLPPWLILATLALGVVAVARRWPLGEARPRVALAVHGAAALAFPLLHFALIAVAHRALFASPVPLLANVRAMARALYLYDVVIYCAIVGAVHAAAWRARARRRELDAAELEARLAEARLQALRAQLHPHFLFNALNTIAMLARAGDTTAVTTMLAELGALLRHLLRDGPAHESSLAEEVAFLRRYLALEQRRFGDRLATRIEVAEAAMEARVPALVLQPLVENAIRHGAARRAGAVTLVVRARVEGEALRLEVRDDGPGLPAGWTLDGSAGVGLRNTRDRLAQLYGADHALEVVPLPGGGVLAAVTLPFRLAPAAARPHALVAEGVA